MNTLYPIFLQTKNFNILIVGGGNVAEEKVSLLLKSSPGSNITIVAKEISSGIWSMADGRSSILIKHKEFEESDLENIQLVIAATDNKELNVQVHRAAKNK